MNASITLKVARYLTLPADIECGFGAGSEFACYVVRETGHHTAHQPAAWGVMTASELAPILFAEWRNP